MTPQRGRRVSMNHQKSPFRGFNHLCSLTFFFLFLLLQSSPVMRKRHRPHPYHQRLHQDPLQAIHINNNNNNKQQQQVACQASRSWCFPLFCLLIFTWILLFIFNPALSFSTGTFSWHFPRFSGAQADRSNGHQEEQEIGIITHPQEKEVLILRGNENTHEATIKARRKSSRANEPLYHSMSRKDYKCRPLIKEVFFCNALSMCCPRQHGLKAEKGGEFSGKHVLPEAVKHLPEAVKHSHQPSAESRESFQDGDGQGQQHHFEEATENGDSPSAKEDKSVEIHPEHDLFGHVGIGEEQSIPKQVEEVTSEETSISKDSNGTEENAETLPFHDIAAPDSTKSTTLTSNVLNETHPALTNLNRIHLRQEPGDGPYNYASESKGAKVLASNKEAKGASSILNKDKDKYFRTPCNVETKFVDMELSEEMLVVEITIANHEFYSSNVKEFELWGSLAYPTEDWALLGKFEAENSRVPQTFALSEPKWVRYLKIKMLSHYGSDFYCTLSVVEVYGIDAIELLLEDWIAEDSGARVRPTVSQEESSSDVNKDTSSAPSHNRAESISNMESDVDLMLAEKLENDSVEKAAEQSGVKGKNSDLTPPVFHQSGRPAIDAVMKLLMQKVRSLEHSQPIISQNVEHLDERYKELDKAYSKELSTMKEKLEGAVTDMANLRASLQFMERKVHKEKLSLEMDMANQVKAWDADLGFLRDELRRSENKESVALAISLFSLTIAVTIRSLMLCVSALKGKQNISWWWSCSRILWAVPCLSSFIVVFVLSL